MIFCLVGVHWFKISGIAQVIWFRGIVVHIQLSTQKYTFLPKLTLGQLLTFWSNS